ncbi:MAG: hypothetical protein IJO04_03520 [Oscillospiraceae bacterium]|nr:hypothetical protein [Oscillospiraceae bacterium]
MQWKNNPDFRDELRNMPTAQVRELLREEARAEEPDGDLIRLLTDTLEEREQRPQSKELTAGEEAVWARYKSSKEEAVRRRSGKLKRRIVQAVAAAAAACILLFAVPRAANASNFFEMIARWTEDLFELFNSEGQRGSKAEYIFQTDNEDLRQVYDAVVRIGVTDPAVPMWLPESCKLIEVKETPAPKRSRVHARFSNGVREATVTVDFYGAEIAYDILKDKEIYSDYEYNGTVHHIIKNEDVWTVIWTTDTMVAYIIIECPEDTLYQIIDSIYTTEAD